MEIKGDILVNSINKVGNLAVKSNMTTPTDGNVLTWVNANGQFEAAAISAATLAFKNVAVSGQSTLVADSSAATLTLASGTGISLTTNAATDTLTITATNNGTVTSVGLSLPGEFNVTTSSVSTSGTLTASWNTQTTNKVLAAPSGSTGTPTFRALLEADIPTLSQSKVTNLTTDLANRAVLDGQNVFTSLSFPQITVNATGGGGGHAAIYLNRATNNTGQFRWQTAGADNWRFGQTTTSTNDLSYSRYYNSLWTDAFMIEHATGNINFTPAWTVSATTYTGMKVNVTDTASAAASLILDLQVGSSSKFKVDKTGAITATGALGLGSNTITCGAITSSGNLGLGSNTITSGAITASGMFTANGGVTLTNDASSANTIVAGTTNGLKIGTATTQKLGFFNATPVAQQGNTTDLKTVLTNLGFLATGGATPLTTGNGNVNSGSGGFTTTGATSTSTLSVTSTSTFTGMLTANGGLTLTNDASSANTIVAGTTNGLKIGTATTQKIGFFNATPVAQQANTTDIKDALTNLGLLATGGATPLHLDGGALTCGSLTASSITMNNTLLYFGSNGVAPYIYNSLGVLYFVATSGSANLDASANFTAAGFTTTGGVSCGSLSCTGTVSIGSDGNLYRASTNLLKTDDSLQVVRTLTGGAAGVSGSSTLTPDCTAGNHFPVSYAGSVSVSAPTNTSTAAVDGQKLTIRYKNTSAGAGTLTLTTGAYGFRYGTDIVSGDLTAAAGKTIYVGAVYNAADGYWDVVSLCRGF